MATENENNVGKIASPTTAAIKPIAAPAAQQPSQAAAQIQQPAVSTPNVQQPKAAAPQTAQPAATTTNTQQPAASGVPDGYKGIRKSLVDRGVNDNRIGFNEATGQVTIDGTDAYKPEHNIDGTTYADEETINNLTSQAYKNMNNPLQAVRDYTSGKGYDNIVDWDGKNVLVGGTALKPAFVRNGVAYVDKNSIDAAIADYESRNGIKTNKGVLDEYNEKYADTLNGALNRLLNRESFSYNPDNDKNFQAYKEQQTKLADDAFRKVLNDNNTSLEGASGAILAEAMAARQRVLDGIGDKLQEYQDMAYDQYTGETDRQRNNLSDAAALFNDFFNKSYQENRDSINDANTAQQLENREKQRWFDNDITLRQQNNSDLLALAQRLGLDLDNEGKVIENEGRGLDNEAKRENNRFTAEQNAITRAYLFKHYRIEDAQIMPWLLTFLKDDGTGKLVNMDGSEYIPFKNELEYQAAMADISRTR